MEKDKRYMELLEERINLLMERDGLSKEEAKRKAMPYMNVLIDMGVC